MFRRRSQRRAGFTLIELVVVVMILGIMAAIAAPRLLSTTDDAVDNGLLQTIGVIRGAIDNFAAANPGKLPGEDGDQETFKSDLDPYLRGNAFPSCSVGDAKNEQIRMISGNTPHTAGIAGSKATQSWVYNYDTGDFHVNFDGTSADGETTYDEF